MTKGQDKYQMSLWIRSEHTNPDTITERLAINPKATYLKHERGRPGVPIYETAGWNWQGSNQKVADLAFEELMTIFAPHLNDLKAAMQSDPSIKIKIFISGKSFQSLPDEPRSGDTETEMHGNDIGFYLPAETIAFLNEIKATVSFATYVCLAQ